MYVNTQTKQILSNVDIIRDNPNVSFPNLGWSDEMLQPFGYAELHFPDKHPIPNRFEVLTEGEPVKAENGKWYRTFTVKSLVPELDEQKAIFLAEQKAILKEENAKARYDLETAGITVDGMLIRTDRESQSLITSAYISVKNGLVTSFDWKCADGSWKVLNEQEITRIAQAVTEYIQKCFTQEKQLNDKIDSVTTCEELVELFK